MQVTQGLLKMIEVCW